MGLAPAYSVDGQTDPAKWNYRPHTGNSIYSEVICNFSANGFRLPTEGEWEMAARGGVAGGWDYRYAGSDRIDDVAWYTWNSNDKTHEVGKKKPNALGLYDMSGNVCEWVWESSPDYPDIRFIQGGGYDDFSCEVSSRSSNCADSPDDGRGFRLLRPLN